MVSLHLLHSINHFSAGDSGKIIFLDQARGSNMPSMLKRAYDDCTVLTTTYQGFLCHHVVKTKDQGAPGVGGGT